MRRWRLSRDQFCIFSDNFRSAVYKTYTRLASKNAKYCYLEAVFEAFWSAEIFLGRQSFIVVKGTVSCDFSSKTGRLL